MLGWSILFSYPAVLWASSAVAGPIVIHLLMRRKPRRMIFPAMRFVRASHQAQRAKHRLKHLLLMLMRMLAILLIVLALARPRWVGQASPGTGGDPIAVVVAIDNSGSMGCRWEQGTHLTAGKALAKRFVADLPPGSRLAVITAMAGGEKAGFVQDRGLVRRWIDEVPQQPTNVRVEALLDRAHTMLGEVDLRRKAILLVNDRTAESWRGVDRGASAGGQRGEVYVADCWRGRNENFSLGALRVDQVHPPVGVATPLAASVACGQTDGSVFVELRVAGETVDQTRVNLPAPNTTGPVEFEVTGDEEGLLEGSLYLPNQDRLAMDNTRWFTLDVRPPGTMWVVRDRSSPGPAAPTSFLMANAVAPAGLTSGQILQRRLVSADRLAGRDPSDAAVVLLANVSSLPAAQWRQLHRYVSGGGRLWVVPGDLLSVADYNSPPAQAVLPVRVQAAETLDEPARFRTIPLAGAYVEPFVDEANPPLSEVAIARRVKVQPAAGASVELQFSDDLPAIVTAGVGRGEVLWWSFSPVRSWSNLASGRLAQLPILARRATVVLLGRSGPRADCQVGRPVALAVPEGFGDAAAWVRPPSGQDRLATIDRRSGRITLTPRQVGHWRVVFSVPNKTATLGFAVNPPAAESDLSLLTAEQIAARLSPRKVVVGQTAEQLRPTAVGRGRRVDLLWLAALAAALLLVFESLLSNRFYRMPPGENPPQDLPG